MQVSPTNTITFRYHHPIKTYWRKGLLPTVKRGLYGGLLTQENISLEHLIPHCVGGHTFFSNVALATKKNNNMRGSAPLERFLTGEQVETYLKQFKGVNLPEFNGRKYIEAVIQTLKNLGIMIKGDLL